MEPVELPELLEAYVRAGLDGLHKSVPAIVESYDPTKQTCRVKIAIKQPLPDGSYAAYPPLSEVPVGHLRGGGFIVACPLVAGDAVLLIFQDCGISEWRATGQVSEPKDKRRHGLYCYALPVAAPDTAAMASASGTKLVIGRDGNDQRIEVDAAFISLGAGATDFAALASKVATELNKIATTLATGTSPSGAVTFGTPYVPASVAATLVKLK